MTAGTTTRFRAANEPFTLLSETAEAEPARAADHPCRRWRGRTWSGCTRRSAVRARRLGAGSGVWRRLRGRIIGDPSPATVLWSCVPSTVVSRRCAARCVLQGSGDDGSEAEVKTPAAVRMAALAALAVLGAGCTASSVHAVASGRADGGSVVAGASTADAGTSSVPIPGQGVATPSTAISAGSGASGASKDGSSSHSTGGSATAGAGSSTAPGSPGDGAPRSSGSLPGSTASAPAGTSSAPAGTSVVMFAPFAAGGDPAPGIHVISHAVATGCIALGVAGAPSYRCFTTTSRVLDPCFAVAGATSGPLLCPTDPAAGDVVELSATTLPAATGAASPRPWAVELADGQTCIMVNAAWGGLGPFGCQGSSSSGSIADCHTPVPGSPWWTAACQATESSSSPFVSMRVLTVWS